MRRNGKGKYSISQGFDSQTFVGRRFFKSSTTADGNAQTAVELNPAGICDQRCITIGNLYRFFKFTKIKVTFLSGGTATDDMIVFCFSMGGNMDSPTSYQDINQFEVSAYFVAREVRPRSFSVPSKVLRGGNQKKWFTEGKGDPEMDTQGKFFVSVVDNTPDCIVSSALYYVDFEVTYFERLPAVVSIPKSLGIAAVLENKEEETRTPLVTLTPRSETLTKSKLKMK
jgi:hypothetical protein